MATMEIIAMRPQPSLDLLYLRELSLQKELPFVEEIDFQYAERDWGTVLWVNFLTSGKVEEERRPTVPPSRRDRDTLMTELRAMLIEELDRLNLGSVIFYLMPKCTAQP